MHKLNEDQLYAESRILAGANVFLSGPGGVGKSVLINHIRDNYDEGDTVYLAPTGIAAINIEGATIHRIFRFPLGFLDRFTRDKVSDKTLELFDKKNKVKRIVIDEISMCRADTFVAIDRQLRKIRRINRPFGGIQVIVVGDFFQLPPVLNERSSEGQAFLSEFDSEFCFKTDTWFEAGFETIQLTKVMRQKDSEFIDALNSIRVKASDYAKSLQFLNVKAMEKVEEEVDTIFLCSTNKNADTINSHKFEELEGEVRKYKGKKEGAFKADPVPENLELKVGTKVLICVNNGDEYSNGQLGHVESMHDETIFVRLQGYGGGVVAVQKHKWEEFDYTVGSNGEAKKFPVGSFIQFPLKFGWAITVHKSQGLSLDSAILYAGNGFFCPGQAYVGLSRLRTLEGLYMLKPLELTDVIVDPRVKKFYEDNRYSNLLNVGT